MSTNNTTRNFAFNLGMKAAKAVNVTQDAAAAGIRATKTGINATKNSGSKAITTVKSFFRSAHAGIAAGIETARVVRNADKARNAK